MTEPKQHVTAPIQRVVWAVCSFFILSGVARAQTLPDFSELVERSSPAVVNISTSQKRAMPFKLPKGFELPKDLPVLTKDMDTTVCVKRLFVGSRETNSKGHSSSSTETKRESCG